MTRKVLRALELALLVLIGAGEWVANWIERQSTAIILGLGMLLGVAATMIVGAIYASFR
jgi:predicted tellurium resistance membrane protein TerC